MTVETIKAELQTDLYKITAKQNAELRVQKSDLLEKTKLLEKLLAECHAKLKKTRESFDDAGYHEFENPEEIEERVENYFAGNGAITYAELEIPEEKPVDVHTATANAVLDAAWIMSDTAKGFASRFSSGELGKPKPMNPLDQFVIPIGYELRVGTNAEAPGAQVVVLLLKNSLGNGFTILHIGSSPLGLTDDEILSIQKRIDEVVG